MKVNQLGDHVNCGSCGTPNREGAKFCTECGATQSRSCAACGTDLRSGANFCDECGTPVGAVPPSVATPTASPVVGDAVRKTVTVLFCDLVGSTAFGEAVDPESAREAMGRYFDMAQGAVDQHGGTVAKFIGDGVMAIFGIPEVAEDDAERAVAAGLELQRGFGAIADHISQRYQVDVGLRVGINTGEVVLADEDADIVGDALNTAARLEAACTPGRVMVGEDTWRLTRSTVKYEVLGEVAVKGKTDPIGTFQVVEESGAEEETATPFVGRDRESADLRRVFDEAVAERRAKLVSVIGAPGVGKTRLAAELARDQGEHALTFNLRCERSGAATFAPVAELLRSIADIGVDFDADQITEALRALLPPDVADSDRLVNLLGSLVGASAPRSTEETFFAVRRLFELFGATQPLLVVIDDIQWAEPLFLDLVDHLVEWVDDAAVCIVVLARPEIRDIRPSVAEVGRRVAAVVSIEGLDAAATEQLAAQLLGADKLPPELSARLPDSTQGNPLFVRELIRMLVDDGVISHTDSGWQMAIDADAVEVPPTIQSLLAARVERMPASERRVVELAAVVGTEFPRGALAALDDALSSAGLDRVLETLRRKEVVEPTGTYWGDEPIFRFHHVLIRDAAYRRLLKGARADLHFAVGEWTERTAADLAGEYEATIAFHFEQTHGYRAELGITGDETQAIGDRAAALLATAANGALERDDLAAAGGLAKRALACLGSADPARRRLLILACEALLGAGDVAGGRVVLAEFDEISDDPRLEAWGACFHAQMIVLSAPDELSFAEASVGNAAERLAELGDHAGVAKARQTRAQALARLGRVGDCEAELDLALTAARAADDRRRVTAVLGSAPTAALWGPSPVPRAGGRCLDVIRLLRITSGSPAVEATSVRCQAVLEALRGRFDTARTMLATARATATELGLRQGLMETEFYAGIVELLAGRPADAEPHLRDAYGGLGKLGIGADAGQAAAYLARALLLLGNLDEAEELAAESDALAGQNTQTLIAARAVQAEILASRGQFDEGLQLAREAVALAAQRDIVVDHANACLSLARVSAAAGDTAGADQATAEAARLFEQKGATVDLGIAREVSDNLASESDERPNRSPARDQEASAPIGDGLENAASRVVLALFDTILAVDGQAMAKLVAGDHVFESRLPQMGVGESRGPDGFISMLLELGASVRSGTAEVLAVRGERFCLVKVGLEQEGWPYQPTMSVHEVDDEGREVRHITFDGEDLVDALAELNRLYLETLGQDQREVLGALMELGAMTNSGDTVDGLQLTRDFTVTDHSSLGWPTTDAAGFLERVRAGVGDGMQVIMTEVLGAEAHRCAIAMRNLYVDSPEAETTRFLVLRVVDDEHAAIDIYGDTQRAQATARFQEPFASDVHRPGEVGASPSNEASRVCAEVNKAFNDRDWSAYVAHFAEPYVYDPRHSGPRYREMSGHAELLANMKARADLGYTVTLDTLAVRGEDMFLGRFTFSTPSGDVEERLMVWVIDAARRVSRMVPFDPTDLSAATAELDRLHADSVSADAAARAGATGDSSTRDPGPGGTMPALSNQASEEAIRLSEALTSGDAEWASSRLAPGYLLEDRRAIVASPDSIGPDHVARSTSIGPDLYRELAHVEVIAVRGTDLSLVHFTWSTESEFTRDLLVLATLGPGGQMLEAVMFDADDLPAALVELDQRYLQKLSPAQAATYAPLAALTAAINRGDLEAAMALNADEVRHRDHRTLSWDDHGLDGTRERVGSAIEAGYTVWWSQVERVGPSGVVAAMDTRSPSWGTHHRGWEINLVEAGQVTHNESFGGPELAIALARFEELSVQPPEPDREDAHLPGPHNRATLLGMRTMAAFQRDGYQAFVDMYADDVVRFDRRRLIGMPDVVGREAASRSHDNSADAGLTGMDIVRSLAVRGDALSLTEFRRASSSGDTTAQLGVARFDESDRIDLIIVFDVDDVAAATAELDRLYLESLPDDLAQTYEPIAAMTAAVNDQDLGGGALFPSKDFVAVDHRSASWPDLDKEGFLERIESAFASSETYAGWFTQIDAIVPGVLLASVTMTTSGPDTQRGSFWVGTTADGQIQRLENFGSDQYEAAVARFNELAGQISDPPPSSELTNAASALFMETLVPLYAEHDFETVVGFFRPDAQSFDHRSGISGADISAAEIYQSLEAWSDVGLGSPDFATLATRGDRLALLENRHTDDSGLELNYLRIVEVDADGLVARMAKFDLDDIARATGGISHRYPVSWRQPSRHWRDRPRRSTGPTSMRWRGR